MQLNTAADAPAFDLPGVRFTALASPSLGSPQTCVWQLDVEAGLVGDRSHTLDHDEVFVVLDGRVRVTPGGAEVNAGDTAVVPAGEAIALSNPSDAPARLIVAIRSGFVATMADGTPVGTPPWAA